MKYAVFLAMVGCIPILANFLKSNPKFMPIVWFSLGILPFFISVSKYFDIGLVSWPYWPGYAKGIEFSALDALVIAVLLQGKSAREKLPYRLAMAFYFIVVCATVLLAPGETKVASTFYPWQIFRMYLLVAAVGLYCREDNHIKALLSGLAVGLMWQAIYAVYQRYALGDIQAAGTFAHQNTLGLISQFILPSLFALLLAGQRMAFHTIGVLAGILVAIMTTSRGTVAFAGLGLGLVLLFSMSRGVHARKFIIAGAGAFAALIFIPLTIASFNARFTERPLGETYNERAAFATAAYEMAKENPFGVGSNQFVRVANQGNYYEDAGVAWTSFDSIVHNLYLITAAEIGTLGLLALIAFMVQPLFSAYKWGLYKKRSQKSDFTGDLLIGLAVSLTLAYAQSMFEWVLLTGNVQYFWAISIGLIISLRSRLKKQLSEKPLASNPPKSDNAVHVKINKSVVARRIKAN